MWIPQNIRIMQYLQRLCRLHYTTWSMKYMLTLSWQNQFKYFKFFTTIACGFWNIDIPQDVNDIADKYKDETDVPIDNLKHGKEFYADMLNRLTFFIVTCIIVAAFFYTFIQAWIRYYMSWFSTWSFLKIWINKNELTIDHLLPLYICIS